MPAGRESRGQTIIALQAHACQSLGMCWQGLLALPPVSLIVSVRQHLHSLLQPGPTSTKDRAADDPAGLAPPGDLLRIGLHQHRLAIHADLLALNR